ncbi:MAG: sigma-70 family RNA polymerase sigma factor [Longimicrobiales bacterium]
MEQRDWLAEQFEAKRAHLHAVAYRMLGSAGEADDAVQEAWLRLSRSDADDIENLGGWLTTVVARVSLDMLRARKARREEALEAYMEPVVRDHASDPEHDALLAESIGPALLVVLERLAPAERVAFVLHDMFAVPFGDIAPIVGRTPTAARQLASRARRRVQGTTAAGDADRNRQRAIVDAFLAASRNGDFDALLAVLDPDVVLRSDDAALALTLQQQARGAPKLAAVLHGAEAVADTFKGRASGASRALVNGAAGAVWAPGGKPRVVIGFTVEGGKIVGIEIVADVQRIGAMDVEVLE